MNEDRLLFLLFFLCFFRDNEGYNLFFFLSKRRKKSQIALNIQIFSIFAPEMIGLWCNGNTSDSGPDVPGSNPGSPTKKSKDVF